MFVVLDRRRVKKSGLYPVKIEVVCRRKQKYYLTGQDLSEEEWNSFPRNIPDSAVETIEDRFHQVKSEVENMCRRNDFSFGTLDIYLGKTTECTVNDMMASQTERFLSDGKVNSYYRCRSAQKAIERFSGCSVPLSEVTPDWLKRCEKFWIGEGKSRTTVSIYMKTLKSVINKAYRDGIIPESSYPYGRDRYMVPSGAGRKLALTKASISKIINFRGKAHLERSRDLWLFSYLCNGINFRDMLYLKYSNVIGDEIWFIRSKTKGTSAAPRHIRAVFTPEMKKIVIRWGNAYDGNPGTYLFRYASDNDDAFTVSNKVRRVIMQCNRDYGKIANEIGVPRFTTYSARHSFASVLKWSGVDISFISESLGHSSLLVTERYLAGSGVEERAVKSRLLTKFSSRQTVCNSSAETAEKKYAKCK